MRLDVGPEQMTRSFDACFEIERASAFRPSKRRRDQIETFNCETGGGTALTRRKPDFRMSTALGHAEECDLRPVRRPLWIGVIPVLAGSNLPGDARCDIRDPDMRSLVIEPAGVIELVAPMFIVADVTWRLRHVARTTLADTRDLAAIRRPHETGNSILQIRHTPRFAPAKRQYPHLGPGRFSRRFSWDWPCRQKRDCLSVRSPARAVRRLHGGRQ